MEGCDITCQESQPEAPSSAETSAPEGAAESPAKKTKAKKHRRFKGWDTLEVIEETILPENYEQRGSGVREPREHGSYLKQVITNLIALN